MTEELLKNTERLTIGDTKGESKKSNKSKSRKSKSSNDISPEHIAEVRAKREAAKKAKREALLAKGLNPDIPSDLQFIQRPMLSISREDINLNGVFPFTIMTYNCLAQALIRRKLFPTSGNSVKWFKRSQVLLNEFKHYDADVKCLQEIDYIQFQSFWKSEFEKMGYESQFHRSATKNHGVAIAWKREYFQMTDKMLIDYDKERSNDIEPRTTTKNIGMILSLKFTDKVLQMYPYSSKNGIIIGTTHLFWHPFGTFERTRQCYVVLKKMKEFMHRVNVLQNNNDKDLSKWPAFFCGDFNSQPFDAPYLSLTSKPVSYTGRAKTVLECSTSYAFSKLRDGEEGQDEEGGNIEKFGTNQPETPVPDIYHATEDQIKLCNEMKELHNSIDMRAISLYSIGYRRVHPENAGLNNDRFEPEISNWAHSWNGLLDYLFYIKQWDGSDCVEVDHFDSFEKENGIRILEILKLPPAKEMPNHGQPHEAEYPSDHLCMMIKVGVLM